MKKKLVLASEVIIGVFFLLLLVMVMFAAYAKGEKVELPAVIGILFVISLILAVAVLAIEFILEIWERWKEDGIRSVLRIPVETIIYIVVFMGCDFLISKEVGRIRGYIGYGIILTITMTVTSYWKRVGREKAQR